MADQRSKEHRKLPLTPSAELLKRNFRTKCRFKAVIRFVIRNLFWLEDDVEIHEIGDDVQQNIKLITRKREMDAILVLHDKAILNKPAENRTEEEKIHLFRVIGGLKCFRRYPEHVKQELAAVAYFLYYGPGRVVVLQGRKADALFFVISGEVSLCQDIYDPVLEKVVRQQIVVQGPGTIFGEMCLLHDIPRPATIITKTHCEFLALKKKEFDIVLKETVKEHWDNIQNAMNAFEYFKEWDDITIKECCLLAKMKVYNADQTILGDGSGLHSYVYFIIKGSCQIIEHLLLIPEIKNGRKCYKRFDPKAMSFKNDADKLDAIKAYDTDSATMEDQTSEYEERPSFVKSRIRLPKTQSCRNLPSNVETHFMQVCFLNALSCFGIGENMKNRRVIATTSTECLLIPRYWLLERNIGNIWSKMQHFLNNQIPNTHQVFREFINQRRWLAYRKQLADEIIERRNLPVVNWNSSVPYFSRIYGQIDF